MTMDSKNSHHKYFIYCRKSSEDSGRQVLSIDSQLGVMKEIAMKEDLHIIQTFTESKSAKAPGRDQFNEMVERIEKGEASGILCWKLDRLARNPVDEGKIKWLLQKGVISIIKTPEREYNPNDNVLITSVEFGMANQYLRDLSSNVKRGLKTKLEQGWYPSFSPLGYLNTKTNVRGENQIVKDPERHDLVRKVWDLMLTGKYSPTEVLAIANNDLGLRTRRKGIVSGYEMCKSNIYALLTNPFYYGWFEYPQKSGLWFKGKHEPMVTKEEFDQVQFLLGTKGRKLHKHEFDFTGLIKCGGCGASITAELHMKKQMNGNVHWYTYYHCTRKKDPNCKEKAVEVKNLNAQIDAILGSIRISDEYRDWALAYLRDYREEEADTQEMTLAARNKAVESIKKQIDNLLLSYIAPENADRTYISEADFRTMKMKLLQDKEKIEAELAKQSKEETKWLALSEKAFDTACYAQQWFANGTPTTRRDIVMSLGSNFTLKGQKLSMELAFPFQEIIKNKEGVEQEIQKVLTSEKRVTVKDILRYTQMCPLLCAGEDSNLHAFRRYHLKVVRLPFRHPRSFSIVVQEWFKLKHIFGGRTVADVLNTDQAGLAAKTALGTQMQPLRC
jgi:site-specific DNA recombinase